MNAKPWDKYLLVAVALVVIGLSALFFMKVSGFSERFQLMSAVPNNEIAETEANVAKIATGYVQRKLVWETVGKGSGAAKPVPLFVSIPIVEAKGKLYDMLDPEEEPLRPPVTNTWLITNNLDFLSAGVLAHDPDGDGYTSLEEWDAKTAPTDPDSHPPYADKLLFGGREQQEYTLQFSARPDQERFQIKRVRTRKWPQDENFYLRVGETSDDGQFRLDSFEEKKAKNQFGIEVDAAVLTVTYLPKGGNYQLVKGVETVIPTYFALMQFKLDPSFKEYVKEGDAFNLTIDSETKYRVVKVNEGSVVISYQTGDAPEQTVEIKKN
ncbi:hypothetical protein N9B73_00200 [Verrucomicrobiales bacterium]|nr:hypothetical protein [Verrucomicrobiales bacterium]